ncbi:pseudouridine synthase [Chloroflexus sp.]|uniref:pseudouridine synthase n=1 Tax=Chloroflexus sp. TaxID=1904827 RepID=UPI002ADE3D35|nr:pseudouridine synthase [Chloroflexus sp.]
MSPERLQKVLASAGIASRRDCEALIAAGRVMVNGRVVVVPGTRVDLDHDEVLVDGQPLQMPTKRTYIMLHKPAGVVSTAEDTHGRLTVLDLVNVPARVFPVGRLDMDSEGLILLTDDGELAYALTHPSFEVEKEYRVLFDRALSSEALRSWRNGVLLEGEMTAPAWVELIGTAPEGVWARIVLREGRKRQIRAVAKLLGYEVRRLIRVREGDLVLGDLPPRAWRYLTDEEVAALRAHITRRRPSVEQSPGMAPLSVRDRDDERSSNRTPDVRSRGERGERGREFEREPRARRESGERGREFEREPRARRESGERGREFEREPRARSEERARSTPSRSGPKSRPPSARSSQQQRSSGGEHQRPNERSGRNKEKDQE